MITDEDQFSLPHASPARIDFSRGAASPMTKTLGRQLGPCIASRF